MEYRCLLWDFDGTLADTGSDVWNSLTYAARRAGGAIDDLYMRDDANLADPMDEIMRHVIPYPGEAYLETLDEDVRVHYRTLNDFSRTRLYPGIQSMLNELKEQAGGRIEPHTRQQRLGEPVRRLDLPRFHTRP